MSGTEHFFKKLDDLKDQITVVAQKEYDQWDESDLDTYGGGGICHLIADEIASLLCENNIDCFSHSLDYKQHVLVVAYDKESETACWVDIPEYLYETGGGFTWEKINDVKFTSDFVSIEAVDYDDWIKNNEEIYD